MDRFKIEIAEAGYSIRDNEENINIIEGVSDWSIACELQEMVAGESE
ncbi:MAG: hypothetical protein HQL53_01345 [Magnetococcales bacterium]|nr:hypothetical protein [Magnetococcales bacterium]